MQTTGEQNPRSVEPQPPAYMRRLWERMTEIFGHRWTSAYGDDAACWGTYVDDATAVLDALGLQEDWDKPTPGRIEHRYVTPWEEA